MKIRTALAALLVPMGMILFTACPAQQDGCFDDGQQVQCDDDDDDDRDDDDDDFNEGDDD